MEDLLMKRTVLAAVAVAALMTTSAFAQSTTVTTTAPGAGATITIAPEQRTKIKQYVVQQKVKPVTVKEKVVVGSTLPADVELLTVPSDWGPNFGRYRYVYADDHVAFVDPSSRRVVQIID
jgi:hypothetical protein